MRCAALRCSDATARGAPSPSCGVAPARFFSARCIEAARVRRRRAMQPGRPACDAAAGASSGGLSSSDKPCCAVSFVKATPPGDERQRDVCTTCGFVDYKNPKVVVAAVVVRGRSVLLCKRAIEPSAGKWGFPQGFLELGESARAGAAREALEEAGAVAVPGPLLAVYDVPGSVQLVYLARVRPSPNVGPRHKSFESRFFHWSELPPADELAFPTNAWALQYAQEMLRSAPEGSVWRDCAEAPPPGDAGDAAASAAWFAPQQRTKIMTPPGYVEG